MWLIIAGIVVALAFMLVVVPLIVHRVIGPKLAARIAQVYKPEEIVFQDVRANNFGLESKGRIPLDSIEEVKTVRSHLGKTVGRSLLYVSFAVEGRQDAMAWSVTDVEAWLSKVMSR